MFLLSFLMTILLTIALLIGVILDISANSFTDKSLAILSLIIFIWIIAIKICWPTLLFKELKLPKFLENKNKGSVNHV